MTRSNQLIEIDSLKKTTVRSQVLDSIQNMIVSGKLAPRQKLTETGLASSLGISRGPLREALRELINIGLLESEPYKGIFVRGVTKEGLEEIYSLRTNLEQFAFKQCWDKRDKAALKDLRQRNANLSNTIDTATDPLLAIKQELILHSWCYELSGHQLLISAWERMKVNLQFYFTLHQQAHGRTGPVREAHDTYVELANGDDLEAMLEHLTDHMRQGLTTTIKFLSL